MLFGAFFIVVANLVVDIAYAFLDPRVRYSCSGPAACEVEDLHVHFVTDDGIVKAVDGVCYSVESGRRWASSASPARARASPA